MLTPNPASGGGRDRKLLFPKSAKILRSADFRTVYDQGSRVSNPLFAAFCLRRPTGDARLGVTTPRALGGAVDRNRIKRRLREIFRMHRHEITGSWDIVLNPRRGSIEAPFADLERAFMKVVARLETNSVSTK